MTCTGPDCENRIHIQKLMLCKAHAQQWYRRKDLTPVPQITDDPCRIDSCSKSRDVGGLCLSHRSIGWRMSINEDDLVRMLNTQRCELCGPDMVVERLQIDHDHYCCDGNYSCGRCIRGTLCAGHNGLVERVESGQARDPRVAEYLMRDWLKLEPWVPLGADKKHPTRNRHAE